MVRRDEGWCAVVRMTLTEDDLVAWGRRIGARIRPPVFIGLRGPLGAGKSVLARAVARGAGVRETCPRRLNIVFRYAFRHPESVVPHLYGLRAVESCMGSGLDDMSGRRGDRAGEWPGGRAGVPPRWEVTAGFSGAGPGSRTVEWAVWSRPALLSFPVGIRVRGRGGVSDGGGRRIAGWMPAPSKAHRRVPSRDRDLEPLDRSRLARGVWFRARKARFRRRGAAVGSPAVSGRSRGGAGRGEELDVDDLIASRGAGPGSFTGVKWAAAAAKGLSCSLEVPL